VKLNRHICEVAVKLQEDVGLKAGGQIDSAERSLARMVASLFTAASVRSGFTAEAHWRHAIVASVGSRSPDGQRTSGPTVSALEQGLGAHTLRYIPELPSGKRTQAVARH